jgi:hypothetical protein
MRGSASGNPRVMLVRPRVRSAIALPLVAAGLAGAGCGGGDSQRQDAQQPAPPTSDSSSGATSRPTPREGPRAAWPQRKTLARIAGQTVVLGDRRVRVDPATVTCGGDGGGSRRGGQRVWESFTCVQPLLEGHSVAGPDIVFRVKPTGRRSFQITDQRLTRY